MVLSEVSNREALLALLFMETAWWGTSYLGILVPSLAMAPFPYSVLKVMDWIPLLGILITMTLRFLSVGIFWLAVFQKEVAGVTRMLRIWYLTAIVLEIAFLLIPTFSAVAQGNLGRYVVPAAIFVILRAIFWIFATFILRDSDEPEAEETGDSPPGIWTWTLEKSFLLWEIFWYPVLVIGGLQNLMFSGWVVMLPVMSVTLPVTVLVYACVVVVALVTLVGILRKWKQFLKFWILIYVCAALAYCFVNAHEFFKVRHHQRGGRRHWLSLAGNWVYLGVTLAFPLIASAMRFITIIRTLRFAFTSTKREEGEEVDEVFTTSDFEKQPLLINTLALPPEKTE